MGYRPFSSPIKGVYNPKAFILHAALLPQTFVHWAIFLAAATRRYGPCVSTSVGGHALTPPTRLSLGKPLPYQLADGPQAPPRAPEL